MDRCRRNSWRNTKLRKKVDDYYAQHFSMTHPLLPYFSFFFQFFFLVKGALEAQREMYEKKLADLQTQLQENTSAVNTSGNVTPRKPEQS